MISKMVFFMKVRIAHTKLYESNVFYTYLLHLSNSGTIDIDFLDSLWTNVEEYKFSNRWIKFFFWYIISKILHTLLFTKYTDFRDTKTFQNLPVTSVGYFYSAMMKKTFILENC